MIYILLFMPIFAENITKVQVTTPKKIVFKTKKIVPSRIWIKNHATLQFSIVGKIVFLLQDGSIVNEGEIIAKLENSEAQSRFEMATAIFENEKRKLENAIALKNHDYLSKQHVQEQQFKYNEALGRLNDAKSFLEKHVIRAPFKGKIGLQEQTLGSTITYNSKITTITNFDECEAEFELSEDSITDLGGIEKIKEANFYVSLQFQSELIEAKFAACEGTFDHKTNTIKFRIKLESANNIFPNQKCTVSVEVPKSGKVLSIPTKAIQQIGNNKLIAIVEQNISLKKPIITGISNEVNTEILEGVSENDQIIISSHYSLSEGQKVEVES